MTYYHFAASAVWPSKPFLERESSAALWKRLRNRFEKVAACVIMPDHFHLIVECKDEKTILKNVVIEASALARTNAKVRWQPFSNPRAIPDLKQLKRQIRYVHLNPCRSALAIDPLEWEWSTHRDAVNTTASSWVDFELLCKLMNTDRSFLTEKFHSYVSSDPSVKIEGTCFPSLPPIEHISAHLEGIGWAVSQVTRSTSLATAQRSRRYAQERRLVLLVAERLGVHKKYRAAESVGISSRRARSLVQAPATVEELHAIRATALLLANRSRFEVAEKRS